MKRAFTLIELLVVMAILGLLTSLAVPMAGTALERARGTKCLSNLRAMAQGVGVYLNENQGRFPPALVQAGPTTKGWDFFITGDGENATVEPGWIWRDYGANEVLQCPSFEGDANWGGERYTGYNYNASYLGGMRIERRGRVIQDTPSATIHQVRRPSQTAMFGDGEYAGGANKFMRSPFPGTLDPSFTGREGGTQGYRHNGYTHVAFVDGRVDRLRPVETAAGAPATAEGTGFLSADNELYDLE